MNSEALLEFDTAVLEGAWEFIQGDNLNLAIKLEAAVKAGASPQELGRRYAGVAGEHRAAYRRRIENAARYLQANRQLQTA